MWDIAGCRCILNNKKQVYQLFSILQSDFQIRKINDYIQSPQSDGYRSLHVYVECIDSKKIVEIQLRTEDHHAWATLVEITDLIYNERIKEKKGKTDLQKLLLLFSKTDSMTDKEKMIVIDIVRKYKYIENLTGIFARNYFSIRKQWLSVERKGETFFLIEASKDKIPEIVGFKNFNSAEDEYFKRFTIEQDVNRVLTHLPRPSFKKISQAYSNYFLTYHTFLDDCFSFIEELIISTLKRRRFRLFIVYLDYFSFLYANYIRTMKNEIDEFLKSNNGRKDSRSKEWVQDIGNRLDKRNRSNSKLNRMIEANRPRSWIIRHILGSQYNRIKEAAWFRITRIQG